LSSLEGSYTSSRWSYSRPSSPVPHPEDPIQRVQPPVFDAAPWGIPHTGTPLIAEPVPKEAFTIIFLLEFDGSFKPTPQLKAIVGIDTLAKAAELQVDGNIWATAVVIAYRVDRVAHGLYFIYI
jgi:hypothetical protein